MCISLTVGLLLLTYVICAWRALFQGLGVQMLVDRRAFGYRFKPVHERPRNVVQNTQRLLY